MTKPANTIRQASVMAPSHGTESQRRARTVSGFVHSSGIENFGLTDDCIRFGGGYQNLKEKQGLHSAFQVSDAMSAKYAYSRDSEAACGNAGFRRAEGWP